MKTILIKLTLVFVFYFVLSCSKNEEQSEEHEKHEEQENVVGLTQAQFTRAGIVLSKVEIKNLSSTIRVNGVLDVPPQNMVSVSAMMGGFIKSTQLLQGMRIKKGDVIATIQNPDFIKIQREYLESKQKLNFLELEYKRQEELSKEQVTSAKIFQQATSDYNSLLATVGALEEQLKILNINTNSLNQKTIKSIVNIYSPMSGYVTMVNINIGKFVNSQDVICEIVDTEHLHAELTVFEKDVMKIKKGQKVKFVLVNESDKERAGSIYLINHQIAPDRTVRVHAHLDKEDPSLIPNMFLKALIELGNKQAPALPEKSIVTVGDKNLIFVKIIQEHLHEKQDQDKEMPKEQFFFQAVEIQKGISENGYTEVILPENFNVEKELIVVAGAYDLLSKMNNSGEEGHSH